MPTKKTKPLHHVAEDAICIRSGACACSTVLLDESSLSDLNRLSFDPIQVALTAKPRAHHNQLRRLAGRGRWMSVASRPDILDSDGVPYLDLVVDTSGEASGPGSRVSDQVPSEGHWYDPLEQFLDLPTGQLRLIYCDEFFHDPSSQYEEMATDERLRLGKEQAIYAGAPSILIECPPGFYKARVFTRFDDQQSGNEPPEGSADLAIFMTSVERPKSFKMGMPLLPIHPAEQDIDALTRRVRCDDSNEVSEITDQDLNVIEIGDHGEIKSYVEESVFGIKMALPQTLADEFQYESGLMLSLETCGVTLNGVSLDEPEPSAKIRKRIAKEMKSPGTFVAFIAPSESQREFMGDFVFIHVLKQGRNDKFSLTNGKGSPAVLRKQLDSSGEPLRISLR